MDASKIASRGKAAYVGLIGIDEDAASSCVETAELLSRILEGTPGTVRPGRWNCSPDTCLHIEIDADTDQLNEELVRDYHDVVPTH